ncbi:MAG: hypothetical protein AB1730_06220 [Myxococcota bacterium]
MTQILLVDLRDEAAVVRRRAKLEGQITRLKSLADGGVSLTGSRREKRRTSSANGCSRPTSRV